MMARLPEDGWHRSRPAPEAAEGYRRGGGSCCCCVVVCGGAGGPGDCASPMERWCLRRRRRMMMRVPGDEGLPSAQGGGVVDRPLSGRERCHCGMDYQESLNGCCSRDENSCDSNDSLRSTSPCLPPDRLPRPRICGEDGPSALGGSGSGGRRPRSGEDALGARDARPPPPSNLFLAAPCSSGRGGDGAGVHFPSCGVTEASDCDVVGRSTGCGRRAGGGWSHGARSLPLLVSLLWLLVGTLLVGGASASIMGDGCDWSGSGLMAEMEVSREGGGVGVRPVYLRCSQGAVSWAYPRGALRVLLRLAGSGNDEFRGCVRLGRTWKGARLFLEGVRSLHPLFPGVEDGGEGAKGAGVRCFQSRKGQAALYVEATPGGVSPRGRTVASFEYHLQPLPSGVKSFDPSEECRPCTMEEMTHAFCSSDLVTRGTIRSVETRDDPETSELKVRVTKLIRRTRAPPPALEGDPFDEDDELHEEGETQQKQQPARAGRHRRHWWDPASDRGASVTLHVPTHCGARHGAGEFVFMAQRKLGQLRLKCAPRLEDWAELARKSNRLAASPCVLQA